MLLDKKKIVITGGTSGIGYEIMKVLQANNEVIVIARNAHKLKALEQEYNSVTTFQADLSNIENTEIVANAIRKRYKSIDCLINNAAVQNTPTFLDNDFSHASIASEITLNLTSVCSLSYLLLPSLLAPEKAIILNVNSALALAPKTSSAIYCATKGALNIFTQSLRYQLENTTIDVQQVFLELVDTVMTQGRGANKMTAENAALKIIQGIEKGIQEHDIGKVKLLRILLRLAPSLAKKILKKH